MSTLTQFAIRQTNLSGIVSPRILHLLAEEWDTEVKHTHDRLAIEVETSLVRGADRPVLASRVVDITLLKVLDDGCALVSIAILVLLAVEGVLARGVLDGRSSVADAALAEALAITLSGCAADVAGSQVRDTVRHTTSLGPSQLRGHVSRS